MGNTVMRISKQLNLVVPLQTEGYGMVYIHSTPISRDTFELFYLELGRVFSQCFDSASDSHMAISAPKLAYPALKKMAINNNNWEGNGGVKFGLVNEIKRLSNVIISNESGWQTITFDMAVKQDILDDEDESEALSALVFYCAISRVAPRDLKRTFLEAAGSLRGWQILSSDCTEFLSSLPMLKVTEPITKKGKQSSVVC
jgi:hypothetical protein